jgi:beta-phosphoglucomutase
VIEAVIFDLDGTLVETEELKALSYARAARALRPDLDEREVVEAFAGLVGRSRREVASALVERFGLEEAARERMEEFGVGTPWQAYVRVRLRLYEALLADPRTVLDNRYPHNIALLRDLRRDGRRTALSTMSYREQARRVLGILGLSDAFDVVATREDVERPKPDPEIDLLVARELGVPPGECLVIEDSPSGVEAGLRAGMAVIAVATDLTRRGLRESGLLDRCWVVEDPRTLPDVVRRRIEAHDREAHGGPAPRPERGARVEETARGTGRKGLP